MDNQLIYQILTKFTNEEFDIIDIYHTDSGEAIVIIRFSDIEGAEELVRAINEASAGKDSFIRSALFNSGVGSSISSLVYPFTLFINKTIQYSFS